MSINLSAFAGAGAQFSDANGAPLTGGLLYTYLAGTSTPATTYTTRAGTANNTNPIVLDSAGRTPAEIWLTNGTLYKFVLKSSTYVQIGTYDGIPSINDPTTANTLITVAGTNALTGLATPTLVGYAAGAQYSFVAQNTNTSAVTIDIDTLGVKAVTKAGSVDLAPGDIIAGAMYQITYDGTRFQLINLTSAFQLLVGTTAQRPASPTLGMIRQNSTTGSPEWYDSASSSWIQFSQQTTNSPNTFEFKNRIINGDFKIDQRNNGAAQTYTAAASAAYGADRFIAFCSGANVTGQRITGIGSSQYGYRFTGAFGTTGINFGQRIESYNIYDCANSTVTLSAVISNSLLTTVTWTAYYPTAVDNYTSITLISTGNFTVTNTPTKYSVNIELPANAVNGVLILFNVGSQASGTWDITGIQLERGTTASSFNYRDYGRELILCQRYCQWVPFTLGFQSVAGSSQLTMDVSYRTEMRVTPSFATITADPNATQITLNNSSNSFIPTYSSTTGGCASLLATAAGSCAVYGYRSLASAEL